MPRDLMLATVAAVVVGITFVLAGGAKLLAGPDWTRQAADLGVDRPLALAVPYVEIVLGALLLVQLLEPWPAIAALGLLVAFTVVIVRRILDGSRPPCACFGRRSNRPLGAVHVLRNLVLIGLAAAAAVGA